MWSTKLLTVSTQPTHAASGGGSRLAGYSLTPPRLLSRDGRHLAAVPACGPAAVLSHRSAADLLELRATDRHRIEVTIPGRARRSQCGVQVHRSRTLDPAREVTAIRGIPVTTPIGDPPGLPVAGAPPDR